MENRSLTMITIKVTSRSNRWLLRMVGYAAMPKDAMRIFSTYQEPRNASECRTLFVLPHPWHAQVGEIKSLTFHSYHFDLVTLRDLAINWMGLFYWWLDEAVTRPGNDCYSSLLKPWPIEIVDLPIKDGDFPYYVSLPEGRVSENPRFLEYSGLLDW